MSSTFNRVNREEDDVKLKRFCFYTVCTLCSFVGTRSLVSSPFLFSPFLLLLFYLIYESSLFPMAKSLPLTPLQGPRDPSWWNRSSSDLICVDPFFNTEDQVSLSDTSKLHGKMWRDETFAGERDGWKEWVWCIWEKQRGQMSEGIYFSDGSCQVGACGVIPAMIPRLETVYHVIRTFEGIESKFLGNKVVWSSRWGVKSIGNGVFDIWKTVEESVSIGWRSETGSLLLMVKYR